MTGADLERLPLSGWIVGRADGLFEYLLEFEPGAIEAEIAIIRGDDLQPYDAVSWARGTRSPWWQFNGSATVIGQHELDSAWWDERPARLLETPADYIAAHGAGAVILDWTSDINAIIGRADVIECATPALYQRLRETLIAQAMPRGLTIAVTAKGTHASVSLSVAA